MAKKSSSKKSFKSLFSKSEANLTDSVEKDNGGRNIFKLFKFKKKRKPNKDEEKQVVVGAAETNGSGGDALRRDAEDWPDVSHTKKTRSLSAPRSKHITPPPPLSLTIPPSAFPSIARKQAKDLSYSEMDLRAKPKRFGTFTFGLKRRKKKSDGDLSQSIVVLHSPEPEVKGQEEEEPLNLSLWDIGQGGTLNKRVRFAVSQPDLNTKTLVTSYPPPTVPKKSQAQEPPMDSPKTATNQPNSQMDNIIPLEVGRATRKVPLAMPEMEWNETSQEEESPDVQCDNPYASTDHTDTASLMDVDSFNPSPPPFPPNPPLPSYPSSPPPWFLLSPPTSFSPFSSPPTTVYTSNQSDEISLSPLPSADPVNSGISDPVFPVTELSLSKAEASYVTLSIGQPVVVENISTVTPNTDPSPISLDPNIEATVTETDTPIPEVKTETFPLNADTLADNTETPILITATSALITVNPVTDMDTDSINDASVSTADTSRPMPETVTSITSEAISTVIADPGPSLAEMVIPVPSTDKSTPELRASIANTVNSITNSDNTVPNTDTFSANTEVFGTLCDSLFPQSFTSEQESATSDNDSTEGCLDTNLPVINDVTNPHLSLDNPFDSPSPILPESVKQESETAIDHTEASAGDPTQSTPLQSATDAPVPDMDIPATAVSKMDASHPDTDTTASPNTNLTVTDTDSQPVFGDLYDSLFPGMFPSHHMSGHTASAISSYTAGVVTSDVTMDTRCTPTNIDTSFENQLPPVPQIDTAHPNTDISLTEPEAFASLCFEPTLPTTEPMEMDDLEPELATSDSPLPNTDIAVPDTGSSHTYESLYDFLFPERFPSDQVSTISDPVLDKPVYVTDTDSDLLRPDCNTRPNRVDQSEPLPSALPVYLDTEDTENTDPVLHHSDMNIDNSDHILSDNVTLVSDILSASHPSTKNSSTRETAISIGASVSSTIAETMATETGQEAEVQIMEEEKGQIEENIMSYDVDLVREISNDMSTMVTEKVQEAEVQIMEEANSIDSNRQIKEHMPCDAEVNRASSQHVIIPENSNPMEVAIPAVHYSILEDYMEESGVEEVKSEEMKGRGKQWRNGNETVEVGWSLGSQKVTEVMLETKDRGQENEVHREEKRHIESPEDSDAERLVLVEERGAREVSSLVKEEWEDGVEPALPVQQVHTLMECESPTPPSITEQHGEEEGSGSNRSAVTHAYLVTEARADTHTLRQTPGHEEPQESHSAENKHAATDNRERQDTLATHNTLAHTTDREGSVSDTHTAEKADLVTRTTEDTSSFSEQKATINTTSTHGENTFTLDREETATDTESKTHTGTIEHKGTLGTEWIDSIVTQGTDRSSSEPVPEQVAVNPPVTRDTVLDRLRKRANGLATEDTERPGAEPEQVGGKLSVTADTLLNSLRNRVKFLSQPEGSLDASAVLSTALEDSEDSDSEIQQIVADLESDSEMKSYSSTLTLRPSPTHKGIDKSKQGFRKVSLVTDNDTTDHTEDSVDYSESTVNDPNRTESDLGPVAPEYKWRNLYEGVQTTFEPTGESWRSDSQSDESRVSTYEGHYSSLSPSLSVYTLTSHGPPFQEPGLSSLSSETPRSPGNGRWLSDRSEVQLTRESSEPEAGTGRGSRKEWEEELATAPAGQREREVEQEGREGESMARKIKSGCDLQSLPVSNFSSAGQTIDNVDYSRGSSYSYSGQYKATRVDLLPSPSSLDPSPSSSPVTPDPGSPYNRDIESLVDTLKSMNPNLPQRQRRLRGTTAPSIISSLPSIEEDTPSSSPTNTKSPQVPPGSLLEGPNSRYNLPADLGLNWSAPKEMHSPLELMKLQQQLQQQQQQEQQAGDHHWNRGGLNLPLRASALSSIVMRKSSLGSDSSPEHSPSPLLNGGSSNQSPNPSRLDRSLLYSSYRSASIDQPQENGKAHSPGQRPSLFRTGSLTDIGPNQDHMSSGPGMGMAGGPGSGLGFESGVGTQTGTGTDPSTHFRYDRFSSRMSDSLTGNNTDTNSRMSRPPPLPSFTSTREGLLSPTSSSLDIHRSFANANESALKLSPGLGGMGSNGNVGSVGSIGLGLQRSFSNEGLNSPLFNMGSPHGGSHFSPEAEKNLVPKYRAFPDAYLTKEKEHGKLNPRPGKMFIFDRPGMCGQRMEVWSDVVDTTPWQLQETISIRVVRGGWVLYEKPNFKGEKIALDEGDIELTYPFDPPEEVEGQQPQNGEDSQKEGGEEVVAAKPARRFIIGSVRRVVRDYSVPEISLFPEENAEGKKVTFRDTSDDARIFGFPIKANSIIINAGLWLVYAQPFFQGVPRVLEVGGFPNPAAWGVEHPYVGSVHPLKIGEPRVEKPGEPKLVLYEKPYFTGKTRTIYTNMRDFMTRKDRQQTTFMYSPGSIKVQGGCWVGYEKEGFRGHQYMLEEGEYHDWRVWGGCDAELRSVRVIRADLTEPMLVLYEQPDVEQEVEQDNTFEVTEAIPDVELFGFRTTTRSIHVVSGAWIAYSHVDFSGDQYVLEKGFYSNSADWGSSDNRICSVQPILQAPSENQGSVRSEVMLYTEPDFQGECHVCDKNQESLSDKLVAMSCRVVGGSWVVYEGREYSGNLYILSEGDYPNFTSMGCPPNCVIRSLKTVPLVFSVPSVSLFGLECLEGREITVDTEVANMLEEGYNNHLLSVRVNRGCWVMCEHSNYRGRQFLLEPIEISNWPKFSQLLTIGSMYPVRQRRHFFRIKSKERGHFLSIQGGVEEMKSGRVVVTEQVEGMSEIWFYQEGLIKNKLAPTMSLQVMGNVEAGVKVVLWSETRQPVQTWSAQMRGSIPSLTFPGMVLDIKGGKQYDRDHVVILPESEERPCQQWELELL
ncbi:serine-rich adhesin for platelets-like [Salvelinus alpinus]|uniref:serine-rich adhesin for platelets-like n=1 Tax=Salvelinus alpinus TaxID=8036 RepID=UPI0039FD20A8